MRVCWMTVSIRTIDDELNEETETLVGVVGGGWSSCYAVDRVTVS